MEGTKNYQKRITLAEIQELLTQCRQSGKSKKEFALPLGELKREVPIKIIALKFIRARDFVLDGARALISIIHRE